jgi:large subunit ribosomal protein L5
VAPALQKEFGYTSSMEVPRLTKISLNQGLGSAVGDKKIVENAVDGDDRHRRSEGGPTVSRKDISNFKLRKGMPIGARVTLRGDKMYEFLDRLIAVSLPRTRDFRGVPAKGFDGMRQLHLRCEGADHLPGDRHRQGDEAPRDGHHLRDHGEDR